MNVTLFSCVLARKPRAIWLCEVRWDRGSIPDLSQLATLNLNFSRVKLYFKITFLYILFIL